MSEELNTPEAVPEGSDVSPAEGNGAEATISLDQLKSVLGKDFNDVDSALKSVKDTYSYVGSQAQFKDQINSLTEKLGTDESGVLAALEALAGKPESKTESKPNDQFISKDQYETDKFFAANSQLNDLKDVLTPLKQANPDVSWDDFVKTPHIAQVVESFTGYSELQNKKSVLETNPRIAQAADDLSKANEALDKARQALRTGDVTNSEKAYAQARQSAVEAVLKGNNLN